MPNDTTNKPEIYLHEGALHRAVDEAEEALLKAGAPIFQRGGQLVRVIGSQDPEPGLERAPGAPAIVPVDAQYLAEQFGRAAAFFRYYARGGGSWKAVDPPMTLARAYLARVGEWRLPSLSGVVESPTVQPDGSVLADPGYDPTTGLLARFDRQAFPSIPANPTQEQARKALAVLRDLLSEFPFAAAEDEAVALSGVLTALVGHALPATPLHAFSAPAAGSGKSALVDVAALIATGRPAPVASLGWGAEEAEKRLSGVLQRGDAMLNIDNVEQTLRSDLLCQVLTQSKVTLRPLGQAQPVDMPASTTVFATGNGLVVAGDLTRRTLKAVLDSGMERPEERRFSRDLYAEIPRRREELVTAALTIMAAYQAAGVPEQDIPPLAGFDTWSGLVRQALIWAGAADPVATMERVREADPDTNRTAALYAALYQAFGEQPVTGRAIMEACEEDSELSEAVEVAVGGSASNKALGHFLRRQQDRPVQGLVLKSAGKNRNKVQQRSVIEDPDIGGAGISGICGESVHEESRTVSDKHKEGRGGTPAEPQIPSGGSVVVSLPAFKCKASGSVFAEEGGV